MKTTLAVVLLALALSFCNLMGKRGNTNTNGNSRSSGEIAESSPAASPAEETRKTTAAPPTITQDVPRAGAPGSLPGSESQFRRERAAAAEAPTPATSQNNFRRRA